MRCLIFLLLFSSVTFAQDENLDSFLDKAQKATIIYRETFKNLVAEELRTYEYHCKDETLEDIRKIKSMFIVYPSKDNSVADYRNVIEFNGKDVARDEDDIVKFFTKLTKSSSSDEAVSRLAKEANRFDGKSHAYGLTLGQAPVLQPFIVLFLSSELQEARTSKNEKSSSSNINKQSQPCALRQILLLKN